MSDARRFWALVHRWAGLALAFFLVIVGTTGALLPFHEPLDRLLAPAFHSASAGSARDPLQLRADAERASGGLVPHLRLHLDPGAAVVFPVQSRPGGPVLDFDEIAIDPATGQETGRRRWGDLSEGRVNLMPFLYRLHYSLALDSWGTTILGIAALVWTLDCFVGFYLTLPIARRGWFRRWRHAWSVRTSSPAKREFDLHRAGGLWLWPILLLFAWSSVGFNLNPVFSPVMTALLGEGRGGLVPQPSLPAPRLSPRLDWQQAITTARNRAAETAQRRHFVMTQEMFLNYDAATGIYIYGFRSDRDVYEKFAGARLAFDGDTGALRYLTLPTGEHRRATVETWLSGLHMAAIGGLPVRIAVSVVGLGVTGLSVTGILIWLRRRQARLWHAGIWGSRRSNPAASKT
ncbi:PepSY-associated TM helix domain-containing protein [Sandarakinorhabdus sp. DWP1-3-1]|uniref:PepSY-associated TM helix domain-containing protein n=1 Tax=Sandarakinorhabdus sp. DWP1-3-1 TaxID=2804627 RepID=UPI003CEE040A